MTDRIRPETPKRFFHGLVEQAILRQKLDSSPSSRSYLVQLLDEFVRVDGPTLEGSEALDPTLAELYCRALESSGSRRFRLLKITGDRALFVAGFFADSLSRALVNPDYYIKMGGRAYGGAASLSHSVGIGSLFRELAEKFGRFVEVLEEVSDHCAAHDDTNLLRLYEKWLATGNPHTAAVLQRAGVVLRPDSQGGEPF